MRISQCGRHLPFQPAANGSADVQGRSPLASPGQYKGAHGGQLCRMGVYPPFQAQRIFWPDDGGFAVFEIAGQFRAQFKQDVLKPDKLLVQSTGLRQKRQCHANVRIQFVCCAVELYTGIVLTGFAPVSKACPAFVSKLRVDLHTPVSRQKPLRASSFFADAAAGSGKIVCMQVVQETELKWTGLIESLRGPVHSGLVVAFSGGVDSACLLFAAVHAAKLHGGRVIALTTASESTPDKDLADAKSFAAGLGVAHKIVRSTELQDEQYLKNDHNRCFYCKTELFAIASRVAAEEKCSFVAYGYTASDRGEHRPGHLAAESAGAISPLAESGLHKADIREILRANNFDLADKPAAPCLASRIRTGLPVTAKRLSDVQSLENVLYSAGLRGHRVRIHDDSLVRVECAPADMELLLTLRESITEQARALGYRWTVLDLAGYRTGGAEA